jgi:hypothetical protein
MVRTRRTTTSSWAAGSEVVRTAPRKSRSLLSRFRKWWGSKDDAQNTFVVGDRVRITHADPQFIDRIGVEAIVVSELEHTGDGRMFYRLNNNMSAEPECLMLIERPVDPRLKPAGPE